MYKFVINNLIILHNNTFFIKKRTHSLPQTVFKVL